jgi:hypothetical protein
MFIDTLKTVVVNDTERNSEMAYSKMILVTDKVLNFLV